MSTSKLAYTLHPTCQYLVRMLPSFPSVLADLDRCLGLEGPLAVVPDYAVSLMTLRVRHLIIHIDILQLLPARQLDIVHLRDARSPGNDLSCAGLTSSRNCTRAHARGVRPKVSQATVTDTPSSSIASRTNVSTLSAEPSLSSNARRFSTEARSPPLK